MTLVLRKSHGPWSAGTVIELLTQPDKTREVVTVRTYRRMPVEFEHIQGYSEFSKPKSIIKKKDHHTFDVPPEDIVELRQPKEVVKVKNRKQRRLQDPMVIAKRMAYEGRLREVSSSSSRDD